MGLSITFRALTNWPGKATSSGLRKRSQFSTSWGKTITLLENELDHLNAKNVILEADCDPSEIRLDGHLRSTAKLRGPGIVLSFDSAKGPLRMPCDRFTEWQANVRAIALSLEALRTVDRYGVTQNAEQYKGWTALPDKSQEKSTAKQRAAEFMIQTCYSVGCSSSATISQLLENQEIRTFLYRKIAGILHPDHNNGDDTRFKQLQEHMAAFE